MKVTTITEKCGCGAPFNVATEWLTLGKKAAAEWREGHKHAEGVGICGDQPPPFKVDGVEYPSPHCELRAGHAGRHADGNGGHWRYGDANDAQEGEK